MSVVRDFGTGGGLIARHPFSWGGARGALAHRCTGAPHGSPRGSHLPVCNREIFWVWSPSPVLPGGAYGAPRVHHSARCPRDMSRCGHCYFQPRHAAFVFSGWFTWFHEPYPGCAMQSGAPGATRHANRPVTCNAAVVHVVHGRVAHRCNTERASRSRCEADFVSSACRPEFRAACGVFRLWLGLP
jgi:hypothetical protein